MAVRAASAVRTGRFAGNPGSAVYGTIVVAAQLAIEGAASRNLAAGEIIATLAATSAVFWLAHAYTDTLGSVLTGERDRPSLAHALRAEWPIVESALLPIAALGVAALAGADTSTAVVVGLVAATVELVGWAALAGRRAGQHGVRLIGFALAAGVIGVALIGLKYLIH